MAKVDYHVVRPADEAGYKQFMTDLFAEGLMVLPDRRSAPTDEQWLTFFERRRSEHSVLFIAECEGKVIGGGGVGRIEQPNCGHAVSLGLNVKKTHRNQGVGRVLLSHILHWASLKPTVERIELEVTANNPGAIHLYQAAGFDVEGVKRIAFKKGDLLIDVFQMAIVGSDVGSPKL